MFSKLLCKCNDKIKKTAQTDIPSWWRSCSQRLIYTFSFDFIIVIIKNLALFVLLGNIYSIDVHRDVHKAWPRAYDPEKFLN